MGEIVEKLKRVKPAEEKGEKAPAAGLDVLKKPRAERADDEIEFLLRENPERLKEIRRVVGDDTRKKEEEILILRKTLQNLGTNFERDIALGRSERLKGLEQEMNSTENKLEKAETELAQLKKIKEKLKKSE